MPTGRSAFLVLATLFQGGLAILAFALAWSLNLNPFDRVEFTGSAVVLGIVGTIPMLILFGFTYRFPIGPFRAIKEFLIEALGPPLSECRWYDLAWVAFLAGFSEELLFRAVLQSWLDPWGLILALLISNAVFGILHAITPTYALLAGLLGIYLGLLFHVADGNLLVLTITHSVYDLLAFFVVRREFRLRVTTDAPSLT
ncbi:MAG: CPBP family intramembrane metalloprotease [Planctomycetes bacterium]|nr:CPBP family intramembrane metalloprotease [Planctomycetota bacterium]